MHLQGWRQTLKTDGHSYSEHVYYDILSRTEDVHVWYQATNDIFMLYIPERDLCFDWDDLFGRWEEWKSYSGRPRGYADLKMCGYEYIGRFNETTDRETD
jgi:hypothetical protein